MVSLPSSTASKYHYLEWQMDKAKNWNIKITLTNFPTYHVIHININMGLGFLIVFAFLKFKCQFICFKLFFFCFFFFGGGSP